MLEGDKAYTVAKRLIRDLTDAVESAGAANEAYLAKYAG